MKTKNFFRILLILSLVLFLLTGCDSNGPSQESEDYDVTLKVEYLKEDDLSNLSVQVGDENYSDFGEPENGVLNIELKNLTEKKEVKIAHEDLEFKNNSFTISKEDNGESKVVLTKNMIVDKTAGERFTLSELDENTQKKDHTYVAYPGEYNFDGDFEIYKSGITVKSRTGYKDTKLLFAGSSSVKLGDDDLTFEGFTVKVDNIEEAGSGLTVYKGLNNIKILESDIEGISTHLDVSNLIIKNNKLHDGYNYGININENNEEITIEDNKIFDNSWQLEEKDEEGHQVIYIPQNCSNIEVSNNQIYDNYGMGIQSDSEVTINNNVIENNEYEGIVIRNDSPATLEYNEIKNNKIDGIHLVDSKATIKNNLIENNEDQGIFIAENNEATIEHNLIQENGNVGIILKNDFTGELEYNDINNNGNAGIAAWGENSASNTLVNNNNIYENSLEHDYKINFNIGKTENGDTKPTDNELNIKDNWWGYSELSEEDEYSIVNEDGEEIIWGNVEYEPYKESKIEDAGIE